MRFGCHPEHSEASPHTSLTFRCAQGDSKRSYHQLSCSNSSIFSKEFDYYLNTAHIARKILGILLMSFYGGIYLTLLV
jgi:hypothetical protein